MNRNFLLALGRFCTLLIALMLGPIYSAVALEQSAYSYDALGRLSLVSKSGGRNSGVTVRYEYDATGNRRSMTVSGNSVAVTSGGVIVAKAGESFVISASIDDLDIKRVAFYFGERLIGVSAVADGVATIDASLEEPGLAVLMVKGETDNSRTAKLFTTAVQIEGPAR